MKRFTFLPRVILGLVLFVTGGGISLAADTYVTNTVNGTTYTFKVTSTNTKDKTANVSLSQIGGTDLASYNGTDIDLVAAYLYGTFTVDGTTYTITSMDAMNRNTTINTVEMPSTVTSLPNSCFDGCSALTSVSFPGLTTLPNSCFDGCSALTTFTIPGLKTIGSLAFRNCSSLTDITIPEGATVGERAFQYCTGLKGTLTIPNGANISYKAFDGCSGIESIVLHSGMTSGEHDRNGCFMSMSGVKSVSIIDDGNHTIPANVFGGASFKDGVTLEIDKDITGIGDYAFNHANFPTKLDLSNQFTSYGASAFEGNTAFKGNDGDSIIAVKKPTSATSDVKVGGRAFWITGAKEIDIYPGVDYSGCGPVPTDKYYTTGDGPYNGKNIKTIKFTDGITSIPDYLFLHAKDIPSTCTVTWPTDPTHIGKGAFYGVQFTAAIPSKMSGEGTIGEYAYAHNNMSGEITIPTGCINIGSNALHDCKNITKITVPSTTTSIGEFAFSGCAALASVELPTLMSGDPQLTLGGGFIANDPKLTAFTITNAVKTIYCCSWGNRNDASFSALTSPFTVTLASDKVKAETENRVGGTFFTFEKDGTTENPNTLTIQVANGVTSIPDELFSESTSGNLRQSFIDKIVLSGTDVKSIGKESFNHIRTLLSVDMSGAQNIASIGESAFADCAKLTTVTFGESSNITTVGASAFSGCSALTSVDFGGAKKLQTLGESAFNNCTSLANINQTDGKNDLRGSTLTSIGLYTFGGCSELANLYLPSTLMRINAAAFTNSSASVAKAASDDMVFIKADVPFGITTFSRGFGVKYNSTDNADKLEINGTKYNVWIPTSIDTKTGTLVLQQYNGTQVLSDEVDASVQAAGTEHSYSKQPVGFLLIQDGWQQITPTDLKGDAAKAGTGSVNMRVLISSGTVQKSWTNDDFSGKTLMRGVIDPVNIKDVTDKYGISKRDLALHAMTTKGIFPAGRAYIYAPDNSGSGHAKYSGFTLFYSDEPLTNTTTGINKGVTEVNKDRMADDSYYDLSGRKVNSPTEGIYIHHGRKVVIKRM